MSYTTVLLIALIAAIGLICWLFDQLVRAWDQLSALRKAETKIRAERDQLLDQKVSTVDALVSMQAILAREKPSWEPFNNPALVLFGF